MDAAGALAPFNVASASDDSGHRVHPIDLAKSAVEQVEQGIELENKR